MARLDKFIQAIFQLRAERLVATAGQRVALVTGAETRPVTSQAASAQQLGELLHEIVPADRADLVQAGGEFAYASPSGEVLVRVIRSNGSLEVQITPRPARAAVAAAGAHPGVEEPGAEPAAPAAGVSAELDGIDALFRQMIEQRCSDLHLSAGNPPLFRKDGEIVSLAPAAPLTSDEVRGLVMRITPRPNREQFEEEHDTDFAYEVPGLARFRCNLFLDLRGVGGVFRLIPSRIPAAKDLGLPPCVLDLCSLAKGLVLVTGPTGSGKSTTLAAMIDHINQSRAAHIITIEDPVEFVHPKKRCLINQREVGTHTEGFQRALRAALREDPDIVLVGEMRDLETVSIAIETAETGHLVFGTLHTNTAASTVDRIIDQFPADRQSQVRTMLSESLKGVISQTLCRRVGGGRVAAIEILLVNPAISNLIREAKTFQIPSIMQTSKGQGMTMMNDSLMQLVTSKVIDPGEAYARSAARSEFRSLLQRQGIEVKGI
jgi:twitching motility protein PilT